MPDIYQGAELWDQSLVDPDNRRPVDFATRAKMLGGISDVPLRAQTIDALMDHWRDGGIKLWLIEKILHARMRLPHLFEEASYTALTASGPAADRICAFARQSGDACLIVAVALYPGKTAGDGAAWEGTEIPLPEGTEGWVWYNLLDGSEVQKSSAGFEATALFVSLPVAVISNVG